jgi:hypothetical protein
MYVSRQPIVRTPHIATGTMRVTPAIPAEPTSDSAVARRRVNQREMTDAPTTWPVAARPIAAPSALKT